MDTQHKPNILIVNDDGFGYGLIELYRATIKAFPKSNILVVVPDRNRSGCAFTSVYLRPIQVYKVKSFIIPTLYKISGTPVDCVNVGLWLYEKKGITPDLVLSGCNHGLNLADDWIFSGTLCATIEAGRKRIVSIGFSYDDPDASNLLGLQDVLTKVIKDYRQISKINGLISSVNIPNLVKFPNPEMKYTIPGKRSPHHNVVEIDADGEDHTIMFGGLNEFITSDAKQIDWKVVENGFISISSLSSVLD